MLREASRSAGLSVICLNGGWGVSVLFSVYGASEEHASASQIMKNKNADWLILKSRIGASGEEKVRDKYLIISHSIQSPLLLMILRELRILNPSIVYCEYSAAFGCRRLYIFVSPILVGAAPPSKLV